MKRFGRILMLTEAYRRALQHIERPDLAEQISDVQVNWGMCPRHGQFSDGLIVRRYGDSDEPEPPDPNHPDTPDLIRACWMVGTVVRQLLGEPPLDEITADEAKHKHCLN